MNQVKITRIDSDEIPPELTSTETPFEIAEPAKWQAIDVSELNDERTHIRMARNKLEVRRQEIQTAMSKLDLEFRKIDDQIQAFQEMERIASGVIRD